MVNSKQEIQQGEVVSWKNTVKVRITDENGVRRKMIIRSDDWDKLAIEDGQLVPTVKVLSREDASLHIYGLTVEQCNALDGIVLDGHADGLRDYIAKVLNS